MCSRAFAVWLMALSSLSCARCASDTSLAMSDNASLSTDQAGQAFSANSVCGAPNWHMLSGVSIGRGNAPAKHREPAIDLDVESSSGFQVERASVVYSSQGNQLLVEIKNVDKRWRCGIRSYPSLAFDAAGKRTEAPASDDIGYSVLGATGMLATTRQGIRGSCLAPGETGYLQIRATDELAKVSLKLEATSDGMPVGPPPTCWLPQSYSFSAGQLSIQAKRAGMTDPTYKPAIGGGLAMVLVLDQERLPVALFPLAPTEIDTNETDKTFAGLISLNAGTSQNLAVLIW